ncbi:MAG TPA: class D beta-lactamase [Xanthobacteraceae bacterium]|nr:class D beta-lactamase [Xanthobacteraceae bacterium]
MMDRRSVLAVVAGAVFAPRLGRADVVLPRTEIDDRLAQVFRDAGTDGTFVAYDAEARTLVASDPVRWAKAMLPASTFKIPNSLIALETGVVGDPDKDLFKWDGVTRPFPDWNKDHTLRSAMAASAVPVYQEIARRIGAERMQRFVDELGYGNKNIGGRIDRFWLDGDMRISAVEQIDFLDRLRRGVLPLSARSQQLTRDILPVTQAGDSVIRAKTGLVGVDERATATDIGWLVGWAETGARWTVFALNLDIRERRHIAARMPLAQKSLRLLGAI